MWLIEIDKVKANVIKFLKLVKIVHKKCQISLPKRYFNLVYFIY